MQDMLRVGVVVHMLHLLGRRQILTNVLFLECIKRCNSFSMEDWVALNIKNHMV